MTDTLIGISNIFFISGVFWQVVISYHHNKKQLHLHHNHWPSLAILWLATLGTVIVALYPYLNISDFSVTNQVIALLFSALLFGAITCLGYASALLAERLFLRGSVRFIVSLLIVATFMAVMNIYQNAIYNFTQVYISDNQYLLTIAMIFAVLLLSLIIIAADIVIAKIKPIKVNIDPTPKTHLLHSSQNLFSASLKLRLTNYFTNKSSVIRLIIVAYYIIVFYYLYRVFFADANSSNCILGSLIILTTLIINFYETKQTRIWQKRYDYLPQKSELFWSSLLVSGIITLAIAIISIIIFNPNIEVWQFAIYLIGAVIMSGLANILAKIFEQKRHFN